MAAPASNAEDEVRRCAQCGEAAVVMVFEWKRSTNGIQTGTSTRDYRCQNCGARFSLYPKVESWTFIVLGLIMGIAILPLGFTLFGWLRLRKDKQNPVVPGAPKPPLKYRDGPPARQCSTCQGEVLLTGITRHSHNGLPTGTDYNYRCTTCDEDFIIESVWGHCFSILSGLLVAGIGAGFLLGAEKPGWKYGGSAVALLVVGFVAVQTTTRIRNRFKYPVVEGLLR